MKEEANIVIETSTDTVEETKAALAQSGIEVEESPAEEKEKPAPKDKKEEKDPKPAKEEEAEEEPVAEETEKEEAGEGEPEAEEKAEPEKEKPAKKTPNPTVPRSRLTEEIQKRKDLERRLAERDREKPPAKTEATEPEVPTTYSGKPEPTLADFESKPDKYPDAYAALIKAHGDWSREEGRAQARFEQQQEAQEAARRELTANFNKNLKETIKRIPDYQEIVDSSPVEISGLMERRVYKSPVGGDMLAHWAQNPDEAADIVAMDLDEQAFAIAELETRIKADIKTRSKGEEEEAEEETPPKKASPSKKEVSKAPLPPNRLKPAGPGPKTLQELAGPPDKTGIDIEFNPEYERAVKARRST